MTGKRMLGGVMALVLLTLAGCGSLPQAQPQEGAERMAAEESSSAESSQAGSEAASQEGSEPDGSDVLPEDLPDGFPEQEPIPVPKGRPAPLPQTDAAPNLAEYRVNDGKSGVPLFNSFGAYSWHQRLLEEEVKGFGEIWWFNDGPVAEMYSDRVFADGACYNGVCQFEFQDRRDTADMAALYEVTAEELERTCMDPWPWSSWQSLAYSWKFYVTIQPMTGDWFSPGWIAPEEGTYEEYLAQRIQASRERYGGDEEIDLMEMFRKGGLGPRNPQPASEYQYPAFQPVEGHEGVEMALTAETPDGLPLQVRFRWKTEDGFGCWAEIPGWAAERFYEHLDEWFVKVDTGKEEAK